MVGEQFGGLGQPLRREIKIAEHFGQLAQTGEGLALLTSPAVERRQGLKALQRAISKQFSAPAKLFRSRAISPKAK